MEMECGWGRLAKAKRYQHCHRVLLFGAWLWIFSTWSIQNANAAQYADATTHVNQTAPDTRVADPDSQEPAASQTGAKPTEAADQTDKDKPKDEKQQHPAIVLAPLPIVSPAIGTGIIPILGNIFPLQEKNKNSPPSVVGGAGLITDNGSRGFGLGADLFLKEDR